MNRMLGLLMASFLLGSTAVVGQEIGLDSLALTESLYGPSTPASIRLTDPEFGGITIPYHGKVISKFGKRGSRLHTGTDVKLVKGDTVRCVCDGIVDIAAGHYGYGLLVTVKHADQLTSYYGHLSKILVKKGQVLRSGDVVGLGGSTGRATTAHLHFEFRVAGKPVDSQKYLDFEKDAVLATVIEPVKKATPATPVESATTKPAAQQSNSTADAATAVHTVGKGDTLYKLAKHYGTTVVSLCSLNNISVRTILRIGMELKIR